LGHLLPAQIARSGARATSSVFWNVEVHPGIIVLRESGLTRDEQWDRISTHNRPHFGIEWWRLLAEQVSGDLGCRRVGNSRDS